MSVSFSPEESMLDESTAQRIQSGEPVSYALDSSVLRFIYDYLPPGAVTLETGAGLSTLVFSMKAAHHFAVTPSLQEVEKIKNFASAHQMDLGHVSFKIGCSEDVLPAFRLKNLDMVLIDGKHAFPWPIVDWFYAADMLKKNGLLILDDVQIDSVSILKDFMESDPNWKLVQCLDPHKTYAFEKTGSNIREVAWHLQPFATWTMRQKHRLPVLKKIKAVLKRFIAFRCGSDRGYPQE